MRLIKREGNAAMFKADHRDYWEIHEVKVAPAREMFGKEYPEREVLAGNEEFGRRAWACVTQDNADARFAAAGTVCSGNP